MRGGQVVGSRKDAALCKAKKEEEEEEENKNFLIFLTVLVMPQKY